MTNISQVRKCYNCGAILQSEDPLKEGYIHPDILSNEAQKFTFCDTCFEKEKYHLTPNEPELDKEYLEIILDAKKDKALIVYVVNLFSFEAAFSSKLNELIKDNKLLVIANKRDLLPEELTDQEIIDYVNHRFRAVGLHAHEVLITSELDDVSNRKIIERIQVLRENSNTYIIGPSFAGKTSLVNAFLRVYTNLSSGVIVTKQYKDTKMRVMMIPLDDETYMYDTPGISDDNSFLSYFDKNVVNRIIFNKGGEKRKEKLSEGQSLSLGGYALIELTKALKGHVNLNLYFKPEIQYKKLSSHKTKQKVLDSFLNQTKKCVIKPTVKELKTIRDFDVYDVTVNEINQRDIGILGFGWFSFVGAKQSFRIYVPKGVSIYTSRPKVIDKKLK